MRGGALRAGVTGLGVGGACAKGMGLCLLFTVEGPEGCRGRKKTSKDDSAIIGLGVLRQTVPATRNHR